MPTLKQKKQARMERISLRSKMIKQIKRKGYIQEYILRRIKELDKIINN